MTKKVVTSLLLSTALLPMLSGKADTASENQKPAAVAYIVSLIIYQLGLLFSGSVNVIGLIFAVLFIVLIVMQLVRPYKEANTLRTNTKAKSSVG